MTVQAMELKQINSHILRLLRYLEAKGSSSKILLQQLTAEDLWENQCSLLV